MYKFYHIGIKARNYPGQAVKDDEADRGKVRNHGTRNHKHKEPTTIIETPSQNDETHGEDRCTERNEHATATIKDSEVYREYDERSIIFNTRNREDL